MTDILPIDNYKLNVRHDGPLPIATGKNRMEKNWKNKTFQWSALLKRLSDPTRTQETVKEYATMTKTEQDNIKDVGGFVGGYLKNGQRKAENVENRQLVTLDADFAPPGMTEDLRIFTDYAYAVYSTHKHTPEKPRLRVLIPLDRPVTPDEYEAIARKLAEEIGMDYFDDTTFQPSRLMYWGSVSRDGEYIFDYEDLPWLSADTVLSRYHDWTDVSSWPESSRVKEQRVKTLKKQEDPTEKSGLIGAFCRAYTIDEAIEKFIPEAYIKCEMKDRYTYAEGSTAAGLVIYEEGKFAYSNHATDPASGKLCNAFDLVRIHKYGHLDEEAAPNTATTRLPSYKAMQELAVADDETKLELAAIKQKEAAEEFGDVAAENWEKMLKYDRNGKLENSLNNVIIILQHDPNLKGLVFNQMADNLEVRGTFPWDVPGKFWRDADDAQLEAYLARTRREFSKTKILSAITKVADDRSYHPVREYLDSLPEWDGVPRVDTLLIDYLGAEDTEYVRAVTRKTLCAAVWRVKFPGCKFDTMLIIIGPQGIGKSTLFHRLGGDWFSDSLIISDMRDKTAAEKLQGCWITEIGELAGMRKTESEIVKGFLSRQDDKYRASYGRYVSSHPRQGIIIGTSNTDEFLKDVTGGRRFWPVKTRLDRKKKAWDLTVEEVQQIWAEVLTIYKNESLILSEKLSAIAEQKQLEIMETDEREGLVQAFLEQKISEDWDEKSISERIGFMNSAEEEGNIERLRVSNMEIWCECFRNDRNSLTTKESYILSGILKKLGWKKAEKKERISIYGPQWVYYRQ